MGEATTNTALKAESDFKFGDNAFDIIRLVSALFIVLGHTATHLEIQYPYIIQQILNFWRGLPCLFVTSGFLISASFDRSQSKISYLKKRALRLYPGLFGAFAVSFLCVILIGGGYAQLSYNVKDIIAWIVSQVTVFQFYTPASIAVYGVGNPNGALWTISLEIQMYILIMLILPQMKKMKTRSLLSVVIVALALNALFPLTNNFLPEIVYKLINVTFIPYTYYFLIGMVVYIKKEIVVPLLTKVFWPMLLCYGVIWWTTSQVVSLPVGHYTNILVGPFLCLLTLSGAYKFGKIRFKHDLSYSIYLYHMIVINVLVMFGWRGRLLGVLVVVVATLLLSVLSCRLIEEPFLKKK